MRDQLSQEQIGFYRANGFLVIERCLDDDELARWRTVFDRAVARRAAATGVVDGGLPVGAVPVDDIDIRPEVWPADFAFVQFMNMWQTDDDLRSMLHDERIGRMAAELSGVDGVRVWYDQTFIKQPWAAPTPLHQDNPYWSFTSTDALSIWIALDDVDLTNGALCYLPGTHLCASWEHAPDTTIASIFDVHPEWASIEPVLCPVPAGSVLWHNGLTVHGSGANMTPRPRRVMNCAFMPDGATFNGYQNVLPDDVFASLSVGDVLDDDRRNPIVFSRKLASA